MSARGKSSKRGLQPARVYPKMSPRLVEKNVAAVAPATVDASTSSPPTSTPPPLPIILPPQSIQVGAVESFTISANGNGATVTYTLGSGYHSFSVGDNVVVTGFTNTSFNGTFAITSVTSNTFTVTNAVSGTDSNGAATNANSTCGTIVVANDGNLSIDISVGFDEVLNASQYRLEVTKVD